MHPDKSAVLCIALLIGFVTHTALAGSFKYVDETIQEGSHFTTADEPAPWIKTYTKAWMGAIPDDTMLDNISIPGTHDSAARFGGLAVEAQSWTIAEQLDAGIRFLDIRCRPTGTSFAIHHGAFYQNQQFGSVLNTITAFLRENPTETVIIRWRTKETDPQEGSDSELTIANRYLDDARYKNYFYRNSASTVPKLSDVRGKIFVLREGKIPDEVGMNWRASTNKIQNYYKVFWYARDETRNGNWATLPSKKRIVNEYLDDAKHSSKWMLNQLAGSTGMSPKAVARAVNASAYEHIGKNPGTRNFGTVIMDYPGEKLIYRVIKTNFAPPVIKAAAASEKKAYFFNGEQNKYFRYTSGVGVDAGYPLSIKSNWSTGGREVIAAVMSDNGKGYLFLEGGYYTRSGGADQAGYPTLITDKNWPGLEKYRRDIKAAINWGNGKIYFFIDTGPFRDGRYVRYDIKKNKVDQEAKLVEGAWDKLGEVNDDISAALNYWNGKAYFFTEDGMYYRWDIEKGKVDSGYPRKLSSANNWNVFRKVGRVTAAFRFR